MRQRARQQGFSLLEVLIALTIVSVALAAAVRAVGVASNNARGIQQSSLGIQAAENVLNELRLARAFPTAGRATQPCPQGPLNLVCEQEYQNTGNSRLRLVTVRARLPEGPVVAEVHGLLSGLP
ncbi:type II secretion system minor pseudopilin GspI [Bordetella sp. 15P40C-2]|uniref:type II secretion system minor pseudopilin GspI n=1 Tax=Bordetella sp. 15P40C-2 TaxID=2572246 RepID=UPI00132C0589|nr:type II secretion system minor pseudopilin GspI [Bordetella sp. 15P40C-2]